MKSRADLVEILVANIRKVSIDKSVSIDNIAEDQDFSNYGLDSLDRMSLMIAVEEAVGIDMSEVDPEQFKNINDYVLFIQRNLDSDQISTTN
jgi:acyl carrier protein